MLTARGKIFMLKTLTNFRDVFVPSLIPQLVICIEPAWRVQVCNTGCLTTWPHQESSRGGEQET